jgi:hypothetical protein
MKRSALLLSLVLVGCHDSAPVADQGIPSTGAPSPIVVTVCAPPDLVVDARDMTAHFAITADVFSVEIQLLDGSGWRTVAYASRSTWTPPPPLGFGTYQARVRSTCSDYGGWVPFHFGGTPYEAPVVEPVPPKSCDDPFPGACRQ